MKCRETKASTTAYLLGDLDREQSARIEAHLESCPECRAYAEKQGATLELLRKSLAAPLDSRAKLDKEHRRAIFEMREGDEEQFAPWTVRYGIPLRLAALLLVTVGLFIAILPVLTPSLHRSARPAMSSRLEFDEVDTPVSVAGSAGQSEDPMAAAAVNGKQAATPAERKLGLPGSDLVADESWDYAAAREGGFGGLKEVSERSSKMKRNELSAIAPARDPRYGGAKRHNAPKPADAVMPPLADPEPEMDEREALEGPVIVKGLFAGRSARARERRLVAKEPAPQEDRGEGGGLDMGSGPKVMSDDFDQVTPYGYLTAEKERDVVRDYHAGNEDKGLPSRDKAVPSEEKAQSRELDDAMGEEIFARPHGFNPFVETEENAFSTFGIDCDTASYTMARNFLREGRHPPPASVRSEEFVNFFDYRYSPPRGRLFSIYSECAPSPFGRGLHLIDIGIKGRRLGRDQQRPARLTFAIDCSGSMNTEDRIGLVRLSLERLLDQLSPRDEVAIVGYGSQARLILEHTSVEQKKRILDAVDSLRVSGSTHLEAGLLLAYSQAASAFRSGAVNRVILLSDGRANLGSDSAEQILAQIDEYRKQGIFCSVFGFGIGNYNDDLLETLADKGDGTYAFIDSEQEVERVFVDDLAATLHVIAKDAKIQVEFDPRRVLRYRQIGYENRRLLKEDFRNDSVDAGEVGSGQSVTALYEVELTGESDIPLGIVRVRAFDLRENRVVEVDAPIAPPAVDSIEQASPRIKLAAAAAELAEILRDSPHARGSSIDAVLDLVRPLAQELHLDQKVQELLRILNSARGME